MGRISALTELTSLASNDYIVVLDSSANIAKKITVANAFGIPDFGWVASGESWTFSSYSSSTQLGVVTVPTDATTKYNVDMWVRISQSTGGTKYGRIVAVTSTTLTIFFSTYTLNNEAISSPVYSAENQPLGLPVTARAWTPWVPTVVGWSSTTVAIYRYFRVGRHVTIFVDITGTSNSTSADITLPFNAALPASSFIGVAIWTVTDNGSPAVDAGRAYIGTSDLTKCLIERTLTGGTWTASGSKSVRFTLTYEAA